MHVPQPAILRAINAMPVSKALAIAFTGTFAFSGTLMAFHAGSMKPIRTINNEWEAATEQYMRFYNMNPIHGELLVSCRCTSPMLIFLKHFMCVQESARISIGELSTPMMSNV
jgi:hypothetical protein